jgi:hypothetical protein
LIDLITNNLHKLEIISVLLGAKRRLYFKVTGTLIC